MSKRAVDLSLEELAAVGAKAALRAANAARDAGLVVTGTVDFDEGDQSRSSLAERQPSGAVTLLDAPVRNSRRRRRSSTTAPAARPSSTN